MKPAEPRIELSHRRRAAALANGSKMDLTADEVRALRQRAEGEESAEVLMLHHDGGLIALCITQKQALNIMRRHDPNFDSKRAQLNKFLNQRYGDSA